jgi:hypothetical protein
MMALFVSRVLSNDPRKSYEESGREETQLCKWVQTYGSPKQQERDVIFCSDNQMIPEAANLISSTALEALSGRR